MTDFIFPQGNTGSAPTASRTANVLIDDGTNAGATSVASLLALLQASDGTSAGFITQSSVASTYAPSANPTFTGNVTLSGQTANTMVALDANKHLVSITISGGSYANGVLTITPGSYSLPTATSSVLGGVKQGAGLSVAQDGTLSLSLPTASTTVLGGVKVDGSTITITNGVISSTGGGGGGSLVAATTTTLGGVIVPTSGALVVDGSGNLSVSLGASGTQAAPGNHTHAIYQLTSAKGQASGYAGLDGSSLVPAANIPVATTAAVGGVKVDGTTITIASGVISAASGGTGALTVKVINGTTDVASTGSPYQMLTGDRVVAVNKTTGAATKIFLPVNPTIGVPYEVIDAKGDSATNAISVFPPTSNSATLLGSATTPDIINGAYFTGTYIAINATTWFLV